jgi:1,4-alpha-glucan branching enzyme
MSQRLAVLSLGMIAVFIAGADHDNNVEWNGVSHIDWLDRAPLCPVDGEAFAVHFQTYHYDVTSARVRIDDGSVTWVDATFAQRRGPYDVWTATIPATTPTTVLEYIIELTDGSDTDYLGPGGMSGSAPASGWAIDMLTASHAPVGATLTTDGGAAFKVWAPPPSWYPQGDWISVRGDFNGWGCTALTNDGDDYWYGRAANVFDGDAYKYYFWDDTCGGNDWDYHEDARYRYVDRNNYSNSIVVDPHAYVWTHKDFTPPPFEEMVVYELHVGTFSGYNDGLNRMGRYRDVVDTHLDHLLYLGVNVVELMPVTEFDAPNSWGYDPVNCWAPDESYGTPEDLKYMIDRLHQNGIAVVLDIVYNHFSVGGNYLWEYGDLTYFDRDGSGGPGCDTPWGAQAAFWRQEVRDYYADNVLYWIEEYGVDGFRMDATRYMRAGAGNSGCYPDGATLMQRINDNIDRRKVQAISIAEELPNDPWITSPTPSGAGFDAQWHDQFNDDIRQEIFDAAFGDPEMWRVRSAIDASGYPNEKLVRYVESHDEGDDARLAVEIDSSDPYSIYAKGRSKLGQGLTMLVPGVPMFLQGGEWLEDRAFGSGWNNRIDWSKAVSRSAMTLFFRDVIAVRKANCALRADAGLNLYSVPPQVENDNLIVFTRGDSQEILVVANFSNNNYTGYGIGFPHNGTWYEILNSQASEYAGNGWGNGGQISVSGNYAEITIPQMGLLVFRYADAPGRSADLESDGDVDLRDLAILQRGVGAFGCGRGDDIHENGRVDAEDLFAFMAQQTAP